MVLQNGTLHNEHSNVVDTLLLFLRPFQGVILETEGSIMKLQKRAFSLQKS